MKGVVLSVDTVSAGVDVLEDTASGVLEVVGVDAVDLLVDGGELVLPSGDVVAYSSVDLDEDIVTLVDVLPVALSEGDRLTLLPARSYTQAVVMLDEGGAEVLPVRVPHTMQASLPVGVRDELSARELVTVEVRDDGSFWLVDVMDQPPLEVWGDPMGAAMEMRDTGLSAWTVGPEGRYEASRFGSGDDRLGVFNAEGQIVGGVTADGSLVGQSGVVAGDFSVGGTPLMGRLWDNSPGSPVGWLERFAAGDVATRLFDQIDPQRATGTEHGYAKIGFTARAGRSYAVRVTAQVKHGTTSGAIRSRIRYSTGGGEPTITSSEMALTTSGSMYNAIVRQSQPIAGRISFTTDTSVVVMYTYEGLGGATPTIEEALFELQDLGPQGTYGGGTYTTGRETVPPPTVREYAAMWTATGFRVYDETTQPVTSAPQPAQFGFVGGAHTYTALAFTGTALSGELAGETITQAKTGGTITKAEVFLANTSNGGRDNGTIALGSGSAADLPLILAPQATVYPNAPTGAGIWVQVPASWFTGSNRVVTLGDADGGVAASWFMGPSDEFPPQVRLTITR